MKFCKLLSIATLAMSSHGLLWTATPFNPASIPLALRTPYVSVWLPQGEGNALNDVWPQFWTGSIIGWAGYVSVDGKVYSFLGAPIVTGAQKAVQQSLTFTSTQSIFVLSAGPVNLTATFLSSVEPTDLVKQSLPFSYLALSVASTDGRPHSVKVYTDISAEWISGDRSLTANWTTTITNNVISHQAQLQSPSSYTENSDQIQYGSVYYSTSNGNNVTYQTGVDNDVRTQFISKNVLANTQDVNFRAINDRWPVFGFAKDLGMINMATEPTVFSVGLVRDPAVQYIVAGGMLQDRSLYFWSNYSFLSDVILDFLEDYKAALTRANSFDSQVKSDASKISSDYASLVALSIRQAFGATEITISKRDDGSWNTDDVLIFMKEISSSGNVNTVDVIFPAWPLFLYTNPSLGKYLLQGLFEYQATGQYPNKWSIHDLGSSYPKAIGHNDGKDETMPVEECGNMLIMTLSYAQKSGDRSFLTRYLDLLSQWTEYLIDDSLIPADQISTDDFAGSLANQTNLAIKGIIGIAAMSQIANLTGNASSASNYSSIVSHYVTQFQDFAISPDKSHLTLAYGNNSSWGLTYNLYADKLLGLNVFPRSIYDMQTAWYKTVETDYGILLDTRHTYTKSDWEIWTSAIVTDTSVRDSLISGVLKYAMDGKSNQPLSDWYDTNDGSVEGFRARPVVGGHLALLLV